MEDIARELVRSLRDDVRERAVLLDKAPSDFVTANRTYVAPGNRVIPLSDPALWRDVPFPDPEQQVKLEALSDKIDEAANFEHPARRQPRPLGVA